MGLGLRCTVVLLLGLLALPVAPRLAAAQATPWAYPLTVVPGTEVTLYEATENMRGIGLIGQLLRTGVVFPRFRKATSQLFGVARHNTSICPGTSDCTINATGTDSVDLVTGLGTLGGSFTVVVHGDNPVDSPELVVAKGKFTGTIDFTPIFQDPPLPFGTVTGKMVLDGGGTFPFTGTFRQPVDIGCGFPVYYTGSGPCFGFTQVNPNEFSLSYPTVRFEIKF